MIYNMLATRHYFADGNKRTAHIAVRTWLLSRGYRLQVSYEEAVPFIMGIARGKQIVEIERWIRENAAKTD